jgi:ribosomal-protein-alanine N-acetyltransferase
MATPTPTLSDVLVEGARVRLRPVRPDDAPASFPLVHGVRAVLDWLCWQGPRDLDDLREAYSTWRAESPRGDNYHLAVEALADGTFLGTASLRFADHPHIGDIGYWLGVPHHGRGYGTELVGLLVHIGFELMASTALSAEVFPGNAASVAVLERNGFRLARRAAAAPASSCGTAPTCGGHPDPRRPRDQFMMLRADRPAGRPEPRLVRFRR